MGKRPFKVIIVGGSISGLTLAHCLDRAGIDYVVLEKHHDIHPQLGASIVIFPNGGRILEQLGMFRQIEELSQKFSRIHSCFPGGFYYDNDAPKKIKDMFGLQFTILERRQVLQVLYSELRDKTRVHAGRNVAHISPTDSGVSVTTEDGTQYDGDLVVGADGVHSVVRSEMWRIADLQQPGLISQKEKSSMTVEYICIFGISNSIPGVKYWDHVIRYNSNVTLLVFPGTENGVFWLLIQRLDQKYTYPNVPRFGKEEAVARCESLADLAVWEEVRFGDIWEQRRTFHMTALEEGLLDRWNYGRMVCIGDSVSKITPNQGQGANTAIEAAAGLANVLHALTQEPNGERPSEGEITHLLEQFNRTQHRRLLGVHQAARLVTRLESFDGLANYIFARYVAPRCGDLTVAGIARVSTSGPVLDYIPLTERSGKYWTTVAARTTWKSNLAYPVTKALVNYGTVLFPIACLWLSYSVVAPRFLQW
ncbi:hypothetical protein BDV25DRAFT_171339 [Aspergillus avenaceus]|uniref:FAD-binding domain-containing protein n=1 Tax=Aspergillus avenaceus TaxID=36643 RepID=A0A5N6TYV9_ASPAV|nr:hypothetical protein BDV25DRAFT_171339 [Aspergillus avenaceus]